MQLQIKHATHYTYDQSVDYALQKIRLRPLDNSLQTVGRWSVEVDGGKIEASYIDHYGNHVDLVSANQGTAVLSITAHGTVNTVDAAGVLGKVYGKAPLWHFAQGTELTEPGERIRAVAGAVAKESNVLDGLHALSSAILVAAPYRIGETHVGTSAEEALKLGGGVCQDHANIFVAAARLNGLPARYVSGYLMMNDRVDQDASHAWAEVHLEELGWVGFDVSNGVSPDARYVRIAVGRDAREAAPISGLRLGFADEKMIVTLQVQQ